MKYPKPKKFPVKIKACNVLNTRKKLDVIHTFNTENEWNDYLKKIELWHESGGRVCEMEIVGEDSE